MNQMRRTAGFIHLRHAFLLRLSLPLLLMLLPLLSSTASASGAYDSYVYNADGQAVESLNGYRYRDSIEGAGMAIGSFKGIEDIFVAADDSLYVVDSGNNRIVRMKGDAEVLGVYGDEEGDGKLNEPKGVYVTEEGLVYVADTKNNRIAVFRSSGTFLEAYGVPDSPLLGKEFLYLPSKLVVDKRGYMFIASDGLYQGLLQLKPGGEFAGYYGANHVPFSLWKLLVRFIATEEQKAQIAAERPPEFSNLTQDGEGFIYTTTLGTLQDQIKRLSAVGVDTLNTGSSSTGRYGDLQPRILSGKMQYPSFFDVTVDGQGFMTAIDNTTGKAYQYDRMGQLLFVFGGLGGMDGLFLSPVSIAETSDGTIHIADKTRNRIDRFTATPFGRLVRQASVLYNEGRYEEAKAPWHEVLRLNSNYDLAYVSLGKTLYKQEKYKEAMAYFKLAEAKEDYSKAFHEYRRIVIRSRFSEIALALIGLYAAYKLWRWRRRNRLSARQRGGETV